MSLKNQILSNQVNELADRLNVSSDLAFLTYTHTLLMGKGPASLDFEDLVDGGQDKQIDAISIEELDGRADVYITQATQSTSFSSNKLIQMKNGLVWIFQKSRAELIKLDNVSLRDKILQFREVQSDIGPSNINVHVSFVSCGERALLSAEFSSEMQSIEHEYGNGVFESFELNILGVDEIIELSKSRERQTRSVDADLRIKYDANNPSLISYHSQGLKGMVCTIPAHEIAKLVNSNPDGSIFDLNIRQFLGARGTVNKDIQATSSEEDSYEFWFLNNGITIVCDKFDAVTDPDNPKVKLTNLQIVNGCQTATTLANVQQLGKLKKDTFVIARIYETKDSNLVNKIVLTTNNQNQITSRNLRANDNLQLHMEDAFKIHGYFYERKPKQYETTDISPDKVYTNEAVGQAYLALVLKNPSDARTRRYKIWGELNNKVFTGNIVESYIISAILVKKLALWLRQTEQYKSENTTERIIAKRGLYHIARIAAYIWLGGDEWNNLSKMKKSLKDIENEKNTFDDIFLESFEILYDIIKNSEYADDIERGLKSYPIDRAIEAKLHTYTA